MVTWTASRRAEANRVVLDFELERPAGRYGSEHYGQYRQACEQILRDLSPDLVFKPLEP